MAQNVESMSMQRVPVPRAHAGVSMSDLKRGPSGRWTLVRMMPTDLKRVVQHHFRAEIDGHQRRYLLRHVGGEKVSSAAVEKEMGDIVGEWNVSVPGVGRTWLQRMSDGGTPVANSLIPYTHFGVSLITLLRIGLSKAVKERLYGMFLQLPVYEDMAPWNIQWANGKLAYVDVDTMQSHLEVALPHAYQMILALMNYERTVADFGKCERPVKLPFHIPYVGSCVKSADEMRADDRLRRDLGCTDKLPVPCGTFCAPTFVHCLRELYERGIVGEGQLDDDKTMLIAKKSKKKLRKPKKTVAAAKEIKRLPDA